MTRKKLDRNNTLAARTFKKVNCLSTLRCPKGLTRDDYEASLLMLEDDELWASWDGTPKGFWSIYRTISPKYVAMCIVL